MTRPAHEAPADPSRPALPPTSSPSDACGELIVPESDSEPPADILHVGLLSFEMDYGTLRIGRQWQGERLDCGSFHLLPEEFGALAAWLAAHAEAGER